MRTLKPKKFKKVSGGQHIIIAPNNAMVSNGSWLISHPDVVCEVKQDLGVVYQPENETIQWKQLFPAKDNLQEAEITKKMESRGVRLKPIQLLVGKDGTEVWIDTEYLANMDKYFPTAKLYVFGGLAVWVNADEPVALVMGCNRKEDK